jgi:hypothetical protein
MANFVIDRLALSVPGFCEADGRLLWQLTVERLSTAGYLQIDRAPDSIHVRVDREPGESLELVATRIVEGLMRQLGRS